MIVAAVQDQFSGPTAIAVAGSGWTVLSQGNAGGAARILLYRLAGAAPIDPVVLSSTSSADDWATIAIVVKDVDTSQPIDAWNYGLSTTQPITSPAVTTSTDDCLMLAFVFEDGLVRTRFPLEDLWPVGMNAGGGCTIFSGYTVAKTAGSAPSISSGWGMSSDAAQFVYLAVRNKLNGSLPPVFSTPPVEIAKYSSSAELITSTPLESSLSSIAGVGVNTSGVTYSSNPTAITGWWSAAYQYNTGSFPANAPEQWVGMTHPISQQDMSSGVLSLQPFYTNVPSVYGVIKKRAVILFDTSGNWGAWELPSFTEVSPLNTFATVTIDLKDGEMLGSSVTPVDLAAINKVGYATLRYQVAATTSITFLVLLPLFWRDTSIVGGGPKSPCNVYAIARLLSLFGNTTAAPQGSRQSLLKTGVTVGTTGEYTYSGFQPGESVELATTSQLDNLGASSSSVTVNLSSGDTFNADSASFTSNASGRFVISANSSPSASYHFNNTAFVGLTVAWQVGVPCSGASFFNCVEVLTDGAPFDSCNFYGSVLGVCAKTNNPSNISNCTFTQGDSGGHALEITQPGTFSFVGNTFDGYGLDGTTDAAIYNNSGGHVVLNVSGGGDTPTVRNGAGATTDVVSGAQVSVVGLAAGSQVKVTKVSNGDVLFNGTESGGQVSFSTTYIGAIRIDARKASASPYYKPWFSQANTVSGQTVEITALQELDE